MTAGIRDIMGLVIRWLSTIDAAGRSLYVAASDRQHMNVTGGDRTHLNIVAGDRPHLTVTVGDREG